MEREKKLSRAHEITSSAHDIASSAHEIFFFSPCPFAGSVTAPPKIKKLTKNENDLLTYLLTQGCLPYSSFQWPNDSKAKKRMTKCPVVF